GANPIEAQGATPAAEREVRIVKRLLTCSTVCLLAVVLSGCGASSPGDAPIRIGAVFPISGNAASLAGAELNGVRIAADQVNADGGIGGRKIELVVRDLPSRADAAKVMEDLRASGIRL